MVVNPLKWKLHWQIFAAILLAIAAGWATGEDGRTLGIHWYSVYDFVGRIFLNALKMLIVPLIVSSIIVGIAGIAKSGRLGMLGAKTVGFYLTTTLLAVLAGLVLVNIVDPGLSSDGRALGDELALTAETIDVRERVGEGSLSDLTELFVRIVPENIVASAASLDMLGLIFFALLFGYFMARAEHAYAETLYNFWEGVFQVMMSITNFVMLFAPIGIFGLVAKVVASTGFDAAQPLLIFAATVATALLFHLFITMSTILTLVGRVSPLATLRAMAPALLTAFSTASSMATLPLTLRCVRENVGVSDRTTSFVLPLGATVNMNGTALYECVAAMFIAQAYGLDLNFGIQFVIVVTALVTSIGVAGVPAASMVAIGIILTAIGLPLEALGVLFVFDRLLDMMRTAVNIYGDAVCAIVVARLEGETGLFGESVDPHR
ncbi:MAG: dicarboxylate/amino acid:cation symporter [Gammaproteobacteria bacterium]